MRAPIFVVVLSVLAAALMALLAGPLARPSLAAPLEIASAIEPALEITRSRAVATASATATATAAEPLPGERADRHFIRSHRSPLAGGLLLFPRSFASADGRYDLVIHFNGNTDLVEESYGYAGVNAVLMILNLGVGSGLYEDRFSDPAAFALILDRVQGVMERRGLRGARLGRVAVGGWSSGYGGVMKLLKSDAIFDRIDAVVLFDALHCGFIPGTKTLAPDQIDPIRRYAQKAADGRALLSITHSEIETYTYQNAQRTADSLLELVRVLRTPTTRAQPMPELKSMVGVLPRALMVPLTPLSEAHRGGLHIRGYSGNGPVTHMLHLVQMSTTALPDLVAYWGAGEGRVLASVIAGSSPASPLK